MKTRKIGGVVQMLAFAGKAAAYLKIPAISITVGIITGMTIGTLLDMITQEIGYERPNRQQVAAKSQQRISAGSAGIPRREWATTELRIEVEKALTEQSGNYGLYERIKEQDIGQIVSEAAPYLAAELGANQLNMPKANVDWLENEFAGKYNPKTNTITVNQKIDYMEAKRILPHELFHAQMTEESFLSKLLALYSITPEKSPRNETVVEIVSLEVLANQALDGDRVAKDAFWESVRHKLSELENFESGRAKAPTHDDLVYSLRPAGIIREAVNGKRIEYDGIKLDGITALIQQSIALQK